jgi:hypothetical protein
MKKIMFMMGFVAAFKCYAINDKIFVKAELKNATVFKTGAELTHHVTATLKQGANELVVDNIANVIDINSIQIKTASAVTLMGVEFANNYLVPIEKSVRVKMLEDSVEKLQMNWEILNENLSTNTELFEVLRANKDLKGTQNGLSVSEVVKLMDYYKIKLTELQEVKHSLTQKLRKNEEVKTRLLNQINEESGKQNAVAGKIILQLSVAAQAKYDFVLSYIANNAYWTPFYDVRLEDIKSPMKIITKAKIAQTTGIDWKQVRLSLSTATPSVYGAAPILNAWYLSYINPIQYYNKKLMASNSIQSLGARQLDPVILNETKDFSEKPMNQSQPIYVVDGNVMSREEFSKISSNAIKSQQFLSGNEAANTYGAQAAAGAFIITLKEGLEDYVSVSENTMNMNYDIELLYDIPTTGRPQTATLASQDVQANYKHYAVPKLDKDAYLMAEINDWGKLNLLPGEANIIFEGTYIGKSFIDPSSTNDTLNLTLGRDKRVVVKRDKLIDYSSVKFLGTNKLQKFTYQIVVKNTKKESINLLLKDQFPLSTNKEIEVELTDDGGAEINKDLGILNWKLKIAAGDSKKIKFTYTVKFPKDKNVNIQ